MGGDPGVVDVFDAARLRSVMSDFRPAIVIHQLTDLPTKLDVATMPDALARNARMRDEGTRNLLGASVAVGVRRMIAQSIAFVYAEGPLPQREDAPLLAETDPVWGETVRGVASLERQVLNAPFDGIVLRYGRFYGPHTRSDLPISAGSVQIGAAAKATQLAITKAVPGIYNIAENDGAVATDKAVQILGWDPAWRPEH